MKRGLGDANLLDHGNVIFGGRLSYTSIITFLSQYFLIMFFIVFKFFGLIEIKIFLTTTHFH